MVDFAGWSMPVQYGSIAEEHLAVRSAAGMFDVSHMGRLRFDGPNAATLLDRLVTRRVQGMPPGKIRYALMVKPDGGILDDVLVYHLTRPGAGTFYELVVNASNRLKLLDWITPHVEAAGGVEMLDETLTSAMIAVQGPRALEAVQPLVGVDLSALGYYAGAVTAVDSVEGIVSRTGYTGEDGCELIVPASLALSVWERLAAAGVRPAGLGARDTLRLEAGMPLYGHELTESINPWEAGLAFAVNLEGRTFVGHDVLERNKLDAPRRRVGLTLDGKRVPREGYAVFAKSEGGSEEPVGTVTSGTFSPTLNRPIAMAYVRRETLDAQAPLEVDIRGQREPAKIVPLPFYSRTR